MEGSIKELVSHRISRAEEDLATSKLLLDDGSYRISLNRSTLICLTTPQHIREGSRYPARISHLWYSYQEES